MAYYNEDQLKLYFERAILRESDKKIADLRKEIDYLYQKDMSVVEQELETKKRLELSKSLRELQLEYQDKINQIGTSYDEQLIKERQVMINQIFDEVYKDLNKYILGKDYLKLYQEKVDSLVKLAQNNPVEVLIGESDSALEKLFSGLVNFKITKTDQIHLGGFKAQILKLKLAIDETLDYKLEQQKSWFYDQARLFIK